MINIELWNAIISAGTSVFVVILSQILLSYREKKKEINDEKNYLCKSYIKPIRFMVAENYFRIYEILNEDKKRGDLSIINAPIDVLDKNEDWFVGNGCYLISSCYLMGCLLAYIQNIRNGILFIKFSYHSDTKLMRSINQLVVDLSSDLKIFYVIQMNIGKEFYIKDEERVITYKEFCTLLSRRENFNWYKSLINCYLIIGRGGCSQLRTLLLHLKELAKLLDKIVSGGDSIKQKMLAEGKIQK